jgi:hypothetical protein
MTWLHTLAESRLFLLSDRTTGPIADLLPPTASLSRPFPLIRVYPNGCKQALKSRTQPEGDTEHLSYSGATSVRTHVWRQVLNN